MKYCCQQHIIFHSQIKIVLKTSFSGFIHFNYDSYNSPTSFRFNILLLINKKPFITLIIC